MVGTVHRALDTIIRVVLLLTLTEEVLAVRPVATSVLLAARAGFVLRSILSDRR
jgi:hypothetical protein